MAVSTGSSGDRMVRTASLPSATSYTICGWWQKTGSGDGSWNTIYALDDGGGTNYHIFYEIASSVAQFSIYSNGYNNTNGDTASLFTWYFLAMSNAGTSATDCKIYYASEGSSSLTVVSTTGVTFTPTALSIGGTATFDEHCHATNCNVMVYDTVLTQAQLTNIMLNRQYKPLYWSNLHAWWPMFRGTDRFRDYSANGYDLTEVGACGSSFDPALAWGWHASYQPHVPAATGQVVGPFPTHFRV